MTLVLSTTAVLGLARYLVGAPADVPLDVAGDFVVRVAPCDTDVGGVHLRLTRPVELRVDPPRTVEVRAEEHRNVPVFRADAAPWMWDAKLKGVLTREATTPARNRLRPDSVVAHLDAPDGPVLELGKDYAFDGTWGTLGCVEGGRVGENSTLYFDYAYDLSRIDAVAALLDGTVALIEGVPDIATPRPPDLPEGAARIANVSVPGRLERLMSENLYPILEDAYPEPERAVPSMAERLLPATMAKLRSGEPLKILAWGDSVTVGTFVPDPATQRWQEQFVARLKARFPKATIELDTAAWGGRNMRSFLDEPPGSEFNYREKVLGSGADLIVMEFVNDLGLDPAGVESQYGERLAELRQAGIEWAILTPHYIMPEWMGMTSERGGDAGDPRPYVAGVRAFCAKHDVALADAALRWGRLWRQGIPYMTLMHNAINHPDERGMKLFADALMELFPPE
jgi:lysophospholipase L1-like esterase